MSRRTRRSRRKKQDNPLDRQVGGDHYLAKVQHVEFCQENQLGWCESAAIKYLIRHRRKNGAEDVKKAIHYVEFLIAINYGRGVETLNPPVEDGDIDEFLAENKVPELEADVIRIILDHPEGGDVTLINACRTLQKLLTDEYPEVVPKRDKQKGLPEALREPEGMDLL